jgi:hypothetical protein
MGWVANKTKSVPHLGKLFRPSLGKVMVGHTN